jgi:cytochrome c-type biogenesis protein
MIDVTVGLAFAAGMANFLSPCAFALLPGLLSYLGGRALWAGQKTWTALKHGLVFFLGLGCVYIWINMTPVGAGGWMNDARLILAKLGGVLMALLGAAVTGLVRIPLLEPENRPGSRADAARGYLTSALVGVFFSAGWRSCVGPVLGSILSMGLSGSSPAVVAALLAVFLAGLAAPFLLLAAGVDRLAAWLRRKPAWNRAARIGLGAAIAVVGILLYLGRFSQLGQFGPFFDLGL